MPVGDIFKIPNETEAGKVLMVSDSTYQDGAGKMIWSYEFKTISLFGSMWDTLKYLFTGKVGVDQLSGPVGIYSIVNSQAKLGLEAILYLVAYLSINVGIINLLPFPALDGGWAIILFIELITRRKVPDKVVGAINYVGFMILMGLMVLVTLKDIIFPVQL